MDFNFTSMVMLLIQIFKALILELNFVYFTFDFIVKLLIQEVEVVIMVLNQEVEVVIQEARVVIVKGISTSRVRLKHLTKS